MNPSTQPQQNPKRRRRERITAQNLRRERRLHKQQERFAEPLTAKRAARIASAQAGTEYDPIIRQIRGEAKASADREQQVGQWYDQLAAEQAASANRSLEAGRQDAAGTEAAIKAAGAADTANLAQVAQGNNQLAALVGGTGNAAGQAQIAGGDSARQQQLIALRAPITAADAANTRFLGRVASATRFGGIEARKDESSRRRKILQDLQAARKQKGQATVGKIQDLRKEAVQSSLDRQAFGLESAEAAADKLHQKRSDATAARNAATSRRSANEAARHNRQSEANSRRSTDNSARGNQLQEEQFAYEKKHGTGSINSKSSPSTPEHGPTQSQEYARKKEYKDARATASGIYQQLREQGKLKGNWRPTVEAILAADGYGGSAARWAVSQLGKGVSADPNGESLGR